MTQYGRIDSININDYRSLLGGTQEAHNHFTREISNILRTYAKSISTRFVELYNMNGGKMEISAGAPRRKLFIFHDANLTGVKNEVEVVVNGIELGKRNLQAFSGNEGNIAIKSQEGLVIAEYEPSKEQLYILFDLLKTYPDSQRELEVFKYIVEQMEELIWFPLTFENSWKHSKDRNALIARFTERMRNARSRKITDDEYRLRDTEQRINNYKEQLKRDYDESVRLRRSITTEKANLDKVGESMIRDIDLVAQHEKVKDVHIIDGVFHIWTDDIYAYDKYNNRYYIGKMKFTMNLDNTDVRFYNEENARRSYWTSKDPHPHVDGSNGHACLGSVASTIAELCSRGEVYALALTCIDFLENVNIDDAAGENVRNWDKVDEEGHIIEHGCDEDSWTCEHCEGSISGAEDPTLVYRNVDEDGDLYNERYVCEECRGDYYYHSEYYGEYVHDSISDPEPEEDEEDEDELEEDLF